MIALAADISVLAERNSGRTIVGIVGAPGAGKSTMAEALVARLCAEHGEGWAVHVPMDGFHFSNAVLDRLGRADRKGAPDTFDVLGYVALLKRIVDDRDHPIYVPHYDRVLHESVTARDWVGSHTLVVVTEGNYLAMDAAGWRDVRQLLTELWYLDASDDLREQRLIQRQLAGGRDESAARDWVRRSDRTNGEIVRATRDRCDRVITV